MIYKTLTRYEFQDEFRDSGLMGSYSYEALGLIYDYMLAESEKRQKDIEMCAVDITCEWQEEDEETIRHDYELNDDQNVIEFLKENTGFAGVTKLDTYVYKGF